MLLKSILEEAYTPEKHFDSELDLTKSIRSILRKSSISRYKEIKSKDNKGYSLPQKFGYRFASINDNIIISFFGVERTEISGLARDFTKEKINFKYNDSAEKFLISTKDNIIISEDNLPDAVIDEIHNGTFDVIGSVADSKNDIKNILDTFNHKQKMVYTKLIAEDLVEWKLVKDNNRFKYTLIKKYTGAKLK